MDIAQDHKTRKVERYWSNLVSGETGIYKAEAIDELLGRHFKGPCKSILDIGCGTSVIATTLRDRLGAQRLVFMDYDQAIIEAMRAKTEDKSIEWVVDDIFEVGRWSDRFDLVMLLDMIHEVYSFYGRPVRDVKTEIDHDRGIEAVLKALGQVAQLVSPGGGIIITDDVLSPGRGPVTIRTRRKEINEGVRRFFTEYPSRRMDIRWLDDETFVIKSHELNMLLTQYNKITTGQEDRWNVEQFEIHEYMTESELRDTFDELGFDMHAIVGTPEGAAAEWNRDFEVVAGADALPAKRVNLLAIKRG